MVAFAHDRHRLPGLASLLPAQPTPLLWRPTPWSTPHPSLLAADAKEPDLGKKVPTSNLGGKPDLKEKVTTSNLGRKPDLTEKVASASEGLTVFTEDNKNGSRGSGRAVTSSSRRRSPFNVFGTASVDNEPGKGHGKSQGTETLEQEDGYPTFGGDFVEPYGNTAVFETGGRDRKPLGSEDETVEGEQNGPGEPLTWLPFVDRFPAEHNADRESEDHHTVFAFGNSEVYATVQGESQGRGGYNSAGALPWRRLTATTEPTSKGGLLKLLGCKVGPDSAKVQANLALKELTVAKGQSPGAKGARAWLESKRGTALLSTTRRHLRGNSEPASKQQRPFLEKPWLV